MEVSAIPEVKCIWYPSKSSVGLGESQNYAPCWIPASFKLCLKKKKIIQTFFNPQFELWMNECIFNSCCASEAYPFVLSIIRKCVQNLIVTDLSSSMGNARTCSENLSPATWPFKFIKLVSQEPFALKLEVQKPKTSLLWVVESRFVFWFISQN